MKTGIKPSPILPSLTFSTCGDKHDVLSYTGTYFLNRYAEKYSAEKYQLRGMDSQSVKTQSYAVGEGGRSMKMKRSAWIVGGTTLIGTGVGFILLDTSGLLFMASILIGIGAGLVISQLVVKDNEES